MCLYRQCALSNTSSKLSEFPFRFYADPLLYIHVSFHKKFYNNNNVDAIDQLCITLFRIRRQAVSKRTPFGIHKMIQLAIGRKSLEIIHIHKCLYL